MEKRISLVLLSAVVILVMAVFVGRSALVRPAHAQEGTTVAPVAAEAIGNPVVACTPHAYTSENEEDPFNADRVRRSRTTVTSVVLVFADGTTKVKRVAAR